MIRALLILAFLGAAGCSTREVVVQPDAAAKLSDAQWTIKSAPSARPR